MKYLSWDLGAKKIDQLVVWFNKHHAHEAFFVFLFENECTGYLHRQESAISKYFSLEPSSLVSLKSVVYQEPVRRSEVLF